MRTIGRRTIAVLDEEYQVDEGPCTLRSSSPPADRPSSSTRDGSPTSAGVGPSTSAGDGVLPPESIDDYTIVMDDVDTAALPTTSTRQPPLPLHCTRKRARARFDPRDRKSVV